MGDIVLEEFSIDMSKAKKFPDRFIPTEWYKREWDRYPYLFTSREGEEISREEVSPSCKYGKILIKARERQLRKLPEELTLEEKLDRVRVEDGQLLESLLLVGTRLRRRKRKK